MQKVTFLNLYDVFKTIAENHRQINTFGFGETWDIASSGTVNYPYLWVVPKDSTVRVGEIGFNFEFITMDLVQKGTDNLNDVHSDTHQILCDVLSRLRQGGYNFNIKRDSEIRITPFEEKFDDEVAGWNGAVTIWVDWNFDSCAFPTLNAWSDTHNPSSMYVPLTRVLTINGVSYDLSQDRSWTIDTSSDTNEKITAFAGGGQANATQSADRKVLIETVASSGDSVKTIAATVGAYQHFQNRGANAANIYPQSGANFLGEAADGPLSLAAGNDLAIFCYTAGEWVY